MRRNMFVEFRGQSIPEYLVVLAIAAATILPMVVAVGLAIRDLLQGIYDSL